ARLLEDHGERPPGQQRVRRSVAQLVLQAPGEGEDRLDLLGGEIGEPQEVALHRRPSLPSARSKIAKPSSTCARVMTSGGRKRSTRSAVQLTRSPASRQRSTTAAPGRSRTV